MRLQTFSLPGHLGFTSGPQLQTRPVGESGVHAMQQPPTVTGELGTGAVDEVIDALIADHQSKLLAEAGAEG